MDGRSVDGAGALGAGARKQECTQDRTQDQEWDSPLHPALRFSNLSGKRTAATFWDVSRSGRHCISNSGGDPTCGVDKYAERAPPLLHRVGTTGASVFFCCDGKLLGRAATDVASTGDGARGRSCRSHGLALVWSLRVPFAAQYFEHVSLGPRPLPLAPRRPSHSCSSLNGRRRPSGSH